MRYTVYIYIYIYIYIHIIYVCVCVCVCVLCMLPKYNRCCAVLQPALRYRQRSVFARSGPAHTGEGHPRPTDQNLPFLFTQIPREGTCRRSRRLLFFNRTRGTIFQMPSSARSDRRKRKYGGLSIIAPLACEYCKR